MTADRASYAAQPLATLLDLFAAGEPVPGGGPAAAVGAALGTALVTMAARLAAAKSSAADDSTALASSIARLHALRVRLLDLADQDSVAYALVLAAYRSPKDSVLEKKVRAAMIQAAMQAATDVPLEMMRTCGDVLREAVPIAARTPASARGDLAIGIELIKASLRGCDFCVAVNAGSLKDADAARRLTQDCERIQAAAQNHLTAILPALTAI